MHAFAERAAAFRDVLLRTDFAAQVEQARNHSAEGFEPWPAPGRWAPHRGTALPSLEPGLHWLARAGPASAALPARPGTGTSAGLAERQTESLLRRWRIDDPLLGSWELTAFRGLIAARDAPDDQGKAQVYLGDDSLRFAGRILAAAPLGRGLDVGCGSGITTCALARTCDQVTGIDTNAVALTATRLTAALNGMGGRVNTAGLDLLRVPRDKSFDCVAANLPYVAVPADVDYPGAGRGGPDGLQHIRQLLGVAPELLVPAGGTLLMRFQSAGGPGGPALLADVRSAAARNGWDVTVVCDSRMPREARAALTTHHAMAVNRHRDEAGLLHEIDRHLARAGGPEYYSGDLVARTGGRGIVSFIDLSEPLFLDTPLVCTQDGLPRSAWLSIRAAYQQRARYLPTGYWELGTAAEICAPVRRLASLLAALQGEGRTVREITDLVFERNFRRRPVRARMLYLTTALMMNCLLASGAAVIAANPRPAEGKH